MGCNCIVGTVTIIHNVLNEELEENEKKPVSLSRTKKINNGDLQLTKSVTLNNRNKEWSMDFERLMYAHALNSPTNPLEQL